MKHSTTWRSIVNRALFVFVLLVSLVITAPRAEIAEASPAAGPVQQIEAPIDNSIPGQPIPAPENLYENLVGVVGGPDVTLSIPYEYQPMEETPAEVSPDFQQLPDSGAPLDLTLPENIGLTTPPIILPEVLPAATSPAEPALDQTLGLAGTEVTTDNELAFLSGLTGNLDDFNRADGPLGGAWTDKAAGITILSSSARTSPGGFDTSLSIHNGIGVNEAMARVGTVGSGYVQYAGFAFNYADGQDFIFVKVQDNNLDGLFDAGACYTGNNNFVYFGLGFFNLTGAFSEATLQVTVNVDRSVTIALTNLSGGGADQKYVCAGAPPVNGTQIGIVSFGGGQMDDISVEAVDPQPLTTFTTQDGPLGSNWYVESGIFEVYQQKAFGIGPFPNLATYNSLGANQIEADVSIRPGGGAQYSGLVLNYHRVEQNLFLKVQDNDGDGSFDSGACYIGNNNAGAGFGLGFFSLSYSFTHAHMTVSVINDRVVHLSLTDIDGLGGSQSYDCSGAPIEEGYGVGIASYNGGRVDNFRVVQDFKDNFNRADGPLGSEWVVQAGSYVIENQKAKGTGIDALATMNGIGGRQIEADISLSAGGGTQYSALILDYGVGSSNIFIKVQDNIGSSEFNVAGCYLGNNSGSFGLGFFPLEAPFTTAHMIVSVDAARVVTLVLTNIDGGDDTQAYVCGVAPIAEGPLVGIGGYQGGMIDNVRVSRVFGLDMFNRPNGSLGPGWETKNGTMTIVDQTASNQDYTVSRTVFKNVTGDVVEGDISANPAGGFNFSAFMLNYGVGVNNLFIKFQSQDADPAFETIGCYIGNSSDSFGLGFHIMSAPVMRAHARIWVNSARTVTILLTRIDGGTGKQLYTCAGAPPAEGNLVGIASLNGGRIDNVVAAEYAPTYDVFLPVLVR